MITSISINRRLQKKKPNAEYTDKSKKIRIRSTSITFFEGSSENLQLSGKEKFRLNIFIPISDTLYTHLKNRSTAYQEFERKFSFLSQLISIDSYQVTKKWKLFAEMFLLRK